MTWLPSFEQILRFHKKLVESTGGAIEVRDKGLIDSAINRANASFGGFDLYVSVEEKAAAIGVGLIQNHGFVDGNKRIGIAAMLLILSRTWN